GHLDGLVDLALALGLGLTSLRSQLEPGLLFALGSLLGLLALGLLHRLPALRSPYGRARREDPADAGDGLAAHQPVVVEQPLVLAVELLERVIAEDRSRHLVGDAQHEGVTPADCACRWRYQLGIGLGLIERHLLGGIDAVTERGVDHDRDGDTGVLLHELAYRFVELRKTRRGPPLSGDVRSVEHDVAAHALSPSEPAMQGRLV